MPTSELPDDARNALRCPMCRARLEDDVAELLCANRSCGGRFPIIDGVPILINEAGSIFSIHTFVNRQSTTFKDDRKLARSILDSLPSISKNVGLEDRLIAVASLLCAGPTIPRVLVVGSGISDDNLTSVKGWEAIEVIETDVSFGPRVAVICDGHDLPFADGSFDGVVIQAVLEHVVDPYRCVDEIHRVLRDDGVVYAETPFMQQVHQGRYDFTRFTHLGHRRLFRRFEEISSGAACGPGMALAWSYQFFLLSFVKSRIARGVVRAFASLTAFGLKHLDNHLVDKPAALDAASGYYFLGKKSQQPLTDRELIKLYRGAQ